MITRLYQAVLRQRRHGPLLLLDPELAPSFRTDLALYGLASVRFDKKVAVGALLVAFRAVLIFRLLLADLLLCLDCLATAVHRVGPACVLTSLTTTLALASLILVPHPFVSDFGITAASGTAVALIATLLLVPALSQLFLRRFASEAQGTPQRDSVRRAVDAVCHAAADAVTIAPRTITAVGLLLVLAGGWLHVLNEPRYSYASNLPEDHSALDALHAVDSKLAGANTLQVLIDWPADYDLMSYNTLEVIRKVHRIIESEQTLGAVTSFHAIEQWLGDGDDSEVRLLEFLKSAQTTSLVEGLAAPDENSVLVTAQFEELTSDELEPILDRLERRLNRIEVQDPKVEIAVTGIVPISARASHEMIQQLNKSLMIAIGLILVLIALAMWSSSAGFVSILPNLFPIAIGGAYLYLVEGGLQFTSLVAFTVGFGIAVDSTIHMLNRYRLEKSKGGVAASLRRTITTVGPVVIMSTIVLASVGVGAKIAAATKIYANDRSTRFYRLTNAMIVEVYGEPTKPDFDSNSSAWCFYASKRNVIRELLHEKP